MGTFGVVVLEIISGLKAVDFRQPEVLLVNKVDEFEVRKRPLEALANMGLNGEYNLKELMTLISNLHHSSPTTGHFKPQPNLVRLGTSFYWSSMYFDTKAFVRNYTICQQNQYLPHQKPGYFTKAFAF
ncbi:hypothetical protein HKD37_03G007650 [Glycine soja]